MIKNNEIGVYVHIPFCKKKCDYCDFISYCNKDNLIYDYVQAVKAEIQSQNIKPEITTIYIGGGTPSYIDSKYIIEILEKIKEKNVSSNAEITIEVNPGTVTKEKLEDYIKSGINRISIGLQTTNDELLKQIGRIHSFTQFLETYKLAKKVGFKNINVDLMLGLPNQRIKDLKESLEQIIKLKPKHISVYSLIVEDGTPIANKIEKGEMQLPDEELERNMYWFVKNTLELNGYIHYEISNFAKRGRESVHNSAYWDFTPYLGLGASAHSFDGTVRRSNPANIRLYLHDISMGNISAIAERETPDQLYNEWIMTRLRTKRGMDLAELEGRFGGEKRKYAAAQIARHVDRGYVIAEGSTFRLTRKGIMVSDMIFRDLFVV